MDSRYIATAHYTTITRRNIQIRRPSASAACWAAVCSSQETVNSLVLAICIFHLVAFVTRGLDAQDLEAYYEECNLLKARVTAHHAANTVLFFDTHKTPTNGAPLPVDVRLPDATPR